MPSQKITSPIIILLGLLMVISSNALSVPLAPADVPTPLQPWIKWVSQAHTESDCPYLFSQFDQRYCAWPETLSLDLTNKGGTFSQVWRVYRDTWITLPGNANYWPKQVNHNDQPALVITRNKRPAVLLTTGQHTLSGQFTWQRLPESLPIPPSTALIDVKLNNDRITFPRFEHNRLWLQTTRQKAVEDRFDLQVYRHIDDNIPAILTLRLDIQVAGTAREVLLELPIDANFVPLTLHSPLPAQLDKTQQLRLQVRPGQWQIDLALRHQGPLTSLSFQSPNGPWVDEEVWVFNAHPGLRMVELTGVTAIDPQQTNLPNTWKSLPAYRIQPNDTLVFNEKRRGNPDPGIDNLSLHRTLWLSFNGERYTIHDQIQGEKRSDWRLEMNQPIELGQVTVNHKPQFITQLAANKSTGVERTGVEVRQGQIQLTADSSLIANRSTLPAVGWEHDFNQVSAQLNIPPGWRVFAVSGVDNTSATWLTRWTLLDLFLVLLITIAVAKLWHPVLAGVALLTLAITYHEPDAPVLIWLLLIVGFALLRVLPIGRLRTLILWYRNTLFISFVIITLPFFIQQVRQSLYPQLEHPYQTAPSHAGMQTFLQTSHALAESEFDASVDEALPRQLSRELKSSVNKFSSAAESNRYLPDATDKLRKKMQRYDPNTVLQTGPGLPRWSWNQVDLQWSGPVERHQQLTVYYINPMGNAILAGLRILFITMLMLGLLNIKLVKRKIAIPPLKSFTSGLLLTIVSLALLTPTQSLHAAYPDSALLKTLEQRLFAPADCLPQCAEAQTMQLQLSPTTLTLKLTVSSYGKVAIPLPGNTQHWSPHRILLNDQPAPGVIKDQQGQFWVSVTQGQHELTLEGPLLSNDTIHLALPLKPHYIDIQAQGWEVIGVHPDGGIDSQLQLTRTKSLTSDQSGGFSAQSLPPFVKLQRQLQLGLTWQVETHLTRTSPLGTPIVLQVPLLTGESVTSDGIRVENAHVLVNMRPDQRTMQWTSLLSMHNHQIALMATDTTHWIESWQVDVSPIWHLQYQGINVIQHQNSGRWLPLWQPWPGESVTLTLTKPQGVAGQTITIDQSAINIQPGLRVTDVTLSLDIRSSQGMQHPITLPDNSQLKSVTRNDQVLPLRLNERTLTLPIQPGHQQFQITWQTLQGSETLLRTPSIDIGTASVNHSIHMDVSQNRWILFASGPALGPAVLIWGVLLVILIVVYPLSTLKQMTPLKYWQWVLLSIGLIPIAIEGALVVIVWFFLIGFRAKLPYDTKKLKFNLIQLAITAFTLLTVSTLVFAISQGLLGLPNMQIVGNGSNYHRLNWYQDINTAQLPTAWLVSIPLYIYRILMLLWALWLAFSVVNWARWAWAAFSTHGYWRQINFIETKPGKSKEESKNETEKNSTQIND